MTNADYLNRLTQIFLDHNMEIFGFCNFNDILPLLPCRAVARVPLNAKSIMMFAFPYLVREHDKPKNISYYASVKDYHIVVMDILKEISTHLKEVFPEYSFEPFSDNSPIKEVKASQLAGLGCIGKNGLLITKKYGSYVFLGEIVTDMPLDTTSYHEVCVGCNMCQKFCPTHSINDGVINQDTCLSANTQKKGELPLEVKSLMVECNTAWGCDICQMYCPMNRFAHETYIKEFLDTANHYLTQDNISKDGAYYWRGKKTILRNLNVLDGKYS